VRNEMEEKYSRVLHNVRRRRRERIEKNVGKKAQFHFQLVREKNLNKLFLSKFFVVLLLNVPIPIRILKKQKENFW
jgi:hypothetical protein